MASYYCTEYLLKHLQHFIKQFKQTNQIHSLLITSGYLINNPNNNNNNNNNWQSTLLYNTLIRSHSYSKQPNISLLLYTHMLHHQASPNTHTFPSLLKAAAAAASASTVPILGASLHAQALIRGVLTDPFVQTSLLSFYAVFGNVCDARKVFDEITNKSLVECNAMIDAYCKNGDMGSAVGMFNCMIVRDVVSWSCLINGFAINGRSFVEAVCWFKKMIACFVTPNEATFVSLLSLCSNCNNGESLRIGKQIHGYIVGNEICLTPFMGTALIDLYGKAGFLESAVSVFDRIFYKKVCTWNAMISSLASNGREEEALDMFEKMKADGSKPNEVTFVAVLSACSRAKLVNIGFKLFRSMVSEYKVVPVMEHYGCMVDLMGRAGLLSEAKEFVKNMPIEPDGSVLGALLGACKIHRSIEMGNEVGKKLFELQPRQCGQYVMLSSINAQVERWVNSAELRKAMVNAGIQKTPGYSLIGPG